MEINYTDLILKAQKGDKDSFGILYNHFYQRIYRYCKFNTARVEVAQDICQETFLKAWKALPSFSVHKGGTFQAFLFKIARNIIIDHSRKKKEAKLEEAEQVESRENLEEGYDKEENIRIVQKVLKELDDIDRQIVMLRYFEEMASAEVAKIIGIQDGALRVRTHRVLKKLKDMLEQNYGR